MSTDVGHSTVSSRRPEVGVLKTSARHRRRNARGLLTPADWSGGRTHTHTHTDTDTHTHTHTHRHKHKSVEQLLTYYKDLD